MTTTLYRKTLFALWLALLLLWQQAALAQSDTIYLPAADVNRIVYVANAIHRMDQAYQPEKAALLVFIEKAYAPIPPSLDPPLRNPGTLVRFMAQAQDRFNILYRSASLSTASGVNAMRYPMSTYEALSNMLSILSAQTGNPVASQMAFENIELGRRIGQRVVSDTNPPPPWQASSYDLSEMRGAGGYDEYRNLSLTRLHLLATTELGRFHPQIADTMDIGFGGYFRANVRDTALQILARNPDLRDSPTFAPFAALINPATGEINTTVAVRDTVIRNLQNRFAEVVQAGVNLMQMAKDYELDYVQFYNAPPDSLQQPVRDFETTQAPKMVGAPAAVYAAAFTIAPDPSYSNYKKATAALAVAAKTAKFAAKAAKTVGATIDTITTPSGAAKAVEAAFETNEAAFELTTASLDMAAAAGAFGRSPDRVIMDGINQLSTQINQMQQQLTARIDILDAKLVQIYQTMNSQFNTLVGFLNTINGTSTTILNHVLVMQQSLQQLQSSVNRLTRDIYQFESQASRLTLIDRMNLIDGFVNGTGAISYDTYGVQASDIRSFATAYVLSAAEIGPVPPANVYQDDNIEDQLALAPDPEWNINYLIEFVSRRFVNPQGSDTLLYTPMQPLSNGQVANPVAYEMAATHMMRLASRFPDHFLQYSANDNNALGLGFFGARAVGRKLLDAVGNCTVQFNTGTLRFEKSPLYDNLLAHYRHQAERLQNALAAIEAENNQSWDNPAQRAEIITRIKTQWESLSPSNNGIELQKAAKALTGSRRLLETFLNFGLSRSLHSNPQIQALLYGSNGLHNATRVKQLYAAWTAAAANPRDLFAAQHNTRMDLMQTVLNYRLDNILNDSLASGMTVVGEPFAAIDTLLRRFEYFTATRVRGRVRVARNAQQQPLGAFLPGEPIWLTFRRDNGTYIEAPVDLDSNGFFNVSVPDGIYDLSIKTARFLRKVVHGVRTDQGNIPSQYNAIVIDVDLTVGDLFEDNVVDSRDLIMLRNAWGSTPVARNWNPVADLNNDGRVDNADLNLLKANWGRRGDLW